MTTKQEIAKEIDVNPKDIEVLESDLQSKNDTVASVAVVKVTQKNDGTEDATDQTKVLTQNVAEVMGEEVAKELSDEFDEQPSDIKAQADKVKDAAQDKLDDVKTQATKQVENAKDKADELKDKAADTADELKQNVADKANELKTLADDKADELKDAAQVQVENAKEKATELKEQAGDKVDELKDATEQKIDDIKDKAQDIKQNAQDKLADVKTATSDKAAELKEAGEQKLDELKQNAEDKVEAIKDTAQEQLDTAKDKAFELKEKAGDKVAELKELAAGKVEDVKAKALDVVDSLKDKVQGVKDTAQEQLDSAKDTLHDKKEQAEQFVDDKKQALSEESDSLQEKISHAKEEFLAKKDELLERFDEVKQDSQGKGLGGKLALLGAYVAKMYQDRDDYTAVDLQKDDFGADAFKRQGSQFGQELLGAKAVAATNLANKFISDEKMSAVSEAVYGKLAEWASGWAVSDLSKDERFDRVHTLSDDERGAFAEDVSNQSRALATLGGVTGLMGLKGVVADSAWLLMVSLKSVYQLSMIYDKPLTGKEGAKLAYGILSECDLDKLQEKQVIMTALALGNSVIKNAQGTSLVDELKKIGEKYQNSSYSDQFDTISNYVNLDKFNMAWVGYVLPIGSSVVSAHYNNELIDEVLGVAKATFAKREILGLLEDKSTINDESTS